MNERVQELREQAMEWVPNIADPDTKIRLLNAEKFAELIVRECGIVADHWVNDEDNGRNLVSERLKQHFGVEDV